MPIRVALFDLGGVLVELGSMEAFGDLLGERADRVWRCWAASPWVQRFERGQCDRAGFAAGMIEEFGLTAGPDELLRSLQTWLRGPFDGVTDVLAQLDGRVVRGCLSNTNELHWAHICDEWGLDRWLERRFLSWEIGLLKPDRAIYDHVVAALGCPPRDILFVDDNPANARAARDAGLSAHHVAGFEAAVQVLEDAGLLARR